MPKLNKMTVKTIRNMKQSKKSISILIYLILFINCSFSVLQAQENTLNNTDKGAYFSLITGAGARFGVLTENFYEIQSDGTLYKKSWLTWETLPLFFGTFEFDTGYRFSKYNSITLNSFFSFGIPAFTGHMADYDAFLYDGCITDYSYHDNYTDNFFSTGFYANFCFLKGFGVGIGFEYQNFKFYGKNGYAQHTFPRSRHWNPDMPHTSEYEGNTVITYDITSFFWKPGLVFRHSFANKVNIGLDVWAYLYRYSKAYDIHYKFAPNIPYSYFKDIVEAWLSGFEIHTSVEYAITDFYSVSFRLNGEQLFNAYGDDYLGSPPDYRINEDYKGGFEAWSISGSFSLILKF